MQVQTDELAWEHHFALSPDLLCVVGFDGTFKHINPAWERTLGYSEDELRGQPAIELIHPDDQEAVVEAGRKMLDGLPLRYLESRVRCKNGPYVWIAWSGAGSADDGLIYASGRDISSRKWEAGQLERLNEILAARLHDQDVVARVTETLAVSLDPYEIARVYIHELGSAIGANVGAVYVMEPDGVRVRGFERAVLNPHPPQTDAFLQAPFAEVSAPLNSLPLLYQAVKSGDAFVVEDALHDPRLPREMITERTAPAGLVVPLRTRGELVGIALWAHYGGPKKFSGEQLSLIRSLSSPIAAGLQNSMRVERLRSFARELERNNRELQDFAYVASHDLQEPLRKILAFGDRLKAQYGGSLGSDGAMYLDRMLNAAERMQILINDLLTFSRVTTRAQPFVPINLTRLVRGVLSDLEVRIEQTGGRVEVGDLPTVQADATQMRQLFQNLINNALKFHKRGEAPVVQVCGEVESEFCRVVVADNGIGFDEKYLDRIFNPFQRLHHRGEYEGTGMGLAICRKIVERHGGEITARSAPGQGSTFIVTLPLKQPDGGQGW